MYIECTLAHTVRITEWREAATVDYTNQIRQFSEIGPSGPSTVTPRPWVCYIQGRSTDAQWQTPDGSVVPTIPSGFTQATGTKLYQTFTEGHVALIRGPQYSSPHGEYCCVITADPNQRRCVTLSECAHALTC